MLDGEEKAVHITYAEVDEQARAIGAWLQQMNATGETDVNKAQHREVQTQERIEADLRAKLAEIFSISPSKIDFEQPIKSLGFSSLTAVSKSILKSAMVSSCPCNYFLKKWVFANSLLNFWLKGLTKFQIKK